MGISIRGKYIRKFTVIILICLLWQMAAMIARQGGPMTSSLAPSWGHIITKDLPGFASFKLGATSNDALSYWDAAHVLLINSFITVRRVLFGLLVGGAFGVITGALIGLQPTLRKMFYPVVRVFRNIPLLALIGLFLVWFGGKEEGIIIYIAFGLWIVYCTNTIEAIQNIDPMRVNFARTLGGNKKVIYTQVIFPMIIPNLINTTKVALGVAWAVALGGEFLAAQDGLGRLLIVSQNYVETGRMLIILIIFIMLTELFSWINKIIGDRLTSWMPK